jgi:hypothetical protein
MLTVDEVFSAVAAALEVNEVSIEDSDQTIEQWDSLGQLAIQTALSKLSGGRSDELEDLAFSFSLFSILETLRSGGLIE